MRDASIYLAAALVRGIIGIMDEAIQWATPRRYWILTDIWRDFFATALALVGIARGDPAYADRGPTVASQRPAHLPNGAAGRAPPGSKFSPRVGADRVVL